MAQGKAQILRRQNYFTYAGKQGSKHKLKWNFYLQSKISRYGWI